MANLKIKGLISNLFAIERKDERENISQWDTNGNKMLLWHGTKAENMVGILQTGFRISPPEAYSSGNLLGNGVYFADTFSKCYAYTHNHYSHYHGQQNNKIKKPKKYALLCEVALGKMKEITDIYNNAGNGNIADGIPGKEFQSAKAVGATGPDFAKSIYLSNGCIIPLGPVTNYQQNLVQQQMGGKGFGHRYNAVPNNEYVVYDTTQIRIKYVIELRDQE